MKSLAGKSGCPSHTHKNYAKKKTTYATPTKNMPQLKTRSEKYPPITKNTPKINACTGTTIMPQMEIRPTDKKNPQNMQTNTNDLLFSETFGNNVLMQKTNRTNKSTKNVPYINIYHEQQFLEFDLHLSPLMCLMFLGVFQIAHLLVWVLSCASSLFCFQ